MSTGTDAANCAWGPGTSDGPLSKKRKPPHGAYFRSLPAMTSCERFWRLCLRSNRDQFCVFQSSSNGETIDVVGWRCVRTQDSGGLLGVLCGARLVQVQHLQSGPRKWFQPMGHMFRTATPISLHRPDSTVWEDYGDTITYISLSRSKLKMLAGLRRPVVHAIKHGNAH